MYVFHNDPGHGWLAVKRSELIRLGVIGEISSYSYQKGKIVYLEEDCDADTFCKAKEAPGEKIEVRESYRDNTSIRYYESFRLRQGE